MLIVLLFISRSKVNEIVVVLEIPVEASLGVVELIEKERSTSLEVVLFVVLEGSEQLSKKKTLTKRRNM